MEDMDSVATMLESTNSKIQQLQKAFAELESHRTVTLNFKWKQIEEHFHGLEKSLKRRFTELEDQEKEFEMKTVEAQRVLEKRCAAVMAKEEASLVRLQEKRDVAVSAIFNVLGKKKNGHMESVAASVMDEKPSDCEVNGLKKLFEAGDVKLLSNPQLSKLCEEMDAEGLHRFISDNRKNLASIKEEIPIALKAAGDPGGLVLDSLNGFYVPELSNLDGKKDSNLLGIRRTCIMLMECLSVLLEHLDAGTVSKVISEDVKDRAKIIAQVWKPKLDDLNLDDSNGNSLEAHAFLQLVATFGIHSDFVHEDLSKLIPMVSRRHQTAELCRFLGLSDKMPGVIDVLVNSGRHIDAVNLAFSFELTEQFSPVTLLNSYLAEVTKAPSTVKAGNSSPMAQIDVSERELSALKAVTKCIEEHKLEDQYPLDSLQKRILELEKAKAEKKRATEVVKPQSKRPRANGVVAGYGSRNTNITADKNLYATRYAPPTQYMYDGRQPYAYPGPPENHVHSFIGTPYNIAPNHGTYFGNGYQYQAPYLH
uniref:FRIGIDA-like protein 3 n=1 Tax=Erigeron canadensis TaxID=72917 RepID=UPI001CB88BAB|nr:FRIGIDA-like protein 3 [Erigeron canadensis]